MPDPDEAVAAIEASLAAGVQSPDEAASANAAAEARVKALNEAANKQPEEVATPPAEETPVEVPPVATSEEDTGGPPKRIRIQELEESDRYKIAAATNLAKAEKISFTEALNRLNPPKVEVATPEAAPDPVVTLESELASAMAERNNYGDESSLVTKDFLGLLDKIDSIKEQIREAKAEKRQVAHNQHQSVQEKYDADWAASSALVEKTYDLTAPLVAAVTAEIDQIANDPSHRLHGSGDLPELMFAKHAARLGIAPKTAAPAPKPPVPQGRMLPASGGTKLSPATATSQQNVQSRMAEAFRNGDPDLAAQIAEEDLTGKPSGRTRNAVSIR